MYISDNVLFFLVKKVTQVVISVIDKKSKQKRDHP